MKHRAHSLPSLAVATVLLLLGACSSGGGGGGGGSGGGNGGGGGDHPSGRIEITSDNALLLARSSMVVVGEMAAIGNIATAMVKDGYGLLAEGGYVDIPECFGPYGNETNRISYNYFSPGFGLPSGDVLHAAFQQCTVEGMTITGAIDIIVVAITGNPTDDDGNWRVEAVLSLSPPLEFVNSDGSFTSFTDTIDYLAERSNGILTTTLSAAKEADAGLSGGLNAQHFADLSDPSDPSAVINYQLRPFHLVLVDDSGAGQYTFAVQNHPVDGASLLTRYRVDPANEIMLRIATAGSMPVTWTGGKPATNTDYPVSGEIQFTETGCTSCGSIQADIDPAAVTLTVNDGSAITTEIIDWETLLTTPQYDPSDP